MQEQATNLYDEVEDDGYGQLNGQHFAIPLLLIAGPTSGVITSGEFPNIKPGDWYNSVTKESYGPSIDVIPCYFDEVWVEWKPNLGGLVGIHAPNSIPVKGNVYDGLVSVDGNDVVDTWIYYVLIKGKEDTGVLKLNLSSSSIKYAKVWNDYIHNTRLASGKRAPLFSQYWTLTLEKNSDGKNVWYTFGKGSTANIKHVGEVPAQVYLDHVKPVREIAPTLSLKAEGIEGPAKGQMLIESNESKF